MRISGGDIVIVECGTTEQRDRALKIRLVKSKISYIEATRRVREDNGTGRKEPVRSGTVGKQGM